MIIYVATNQANGKKYIGQTAQSLTQRKNHHIRSALLKRYGTHFHRALVKYGADSFEWKIIEECADRNKLNEREKYYISKFGTFTNGYNMSEGGLGHSNMGGKRHPMYGKHHSQETKQKLHDFNIGKKLSEETKRKIGEASKGRKLSDASRKKISMAHKGKKLSEEVKHKLSVANSGKNHPLYGKKLPKEWREKAAKAQSYEWIIVFPKGEKKIICGLNGFCRLHGLAATSMRRVAKGALEDHRGFKCRRLYKETYEFIHVSHLGK